MHPYPHQYAVAAEGTAAGTVTVTAAGLPDIATTPPPQFDGPEGHWSPETLLAAAVADCFILTFRGVARAASTEWTSLRCEVEAVLERKEGVTRFTRYVTRALLVLPTGGDPAAARALLERAEKVCLVANSLNGERVLQAEVVVAAA